MSGPPLPYGRQEILDEDIAAVADALRADFITQGPAIDRFEEAFADYVGARHAVAFCNGTAALHGAAFAAGVGDGDELITSPMTFAADANCALYLGGRPVFADIDPSTWNIDAAAAMNRVSDRTRAVVAVSYAGLPVDLEPLRDLPDGVTLIEDGCHALGGHRGGRPVGGAGGADMTTFSFHPVKAMTTGEGGMVTTEDDDLARRLRLFRTHGITKENLHPGETDGAWYYEMQALGFNYRITDFQCALGASQLKRLDGWVARRNEIAESYRHALAGDERIELPPAAANGDLHGHHLFVIRVVAGAAARREVFDALRAAGIGVQVHYIPVYSLPYYRDTLGYPQDECPSADRLYSGAISLPMFPAMETGDVDRVVRELDAALG
jgi:UDP-4-amino-4,6-dideoxy-N-acetyl-beta-L-altrosamine transaminase